jgi:hypothetical protein
LHPSPLLYRVEGKAAWQKESPPLLPTQPYIEF